MYKQVKKNIEDIANAKVQWIRLAGTQKITMFRWLSSATIDEGTGKIVLTLDQSLKPHLIQLKEFYTTMNITYTLPMKSQYSLKIYELCKSYQNLYLSKKQKGEPLVWNIDTEKLEEGKDYPMTFAVDDDVYTLHFRYLGKENKYIDGIGSIRCLKLSFEVVSGEVFSGESDLYGWFSDDENRDKLAESNRRQS